MSYTNREALAAMREMEANAEYFDNLDKMIASLDAKAESAKKYKAKHDTAMAHEKEVILSEMSTEPKSIAEILEAVAPKIEGITRNKVIARLTSLIKDGAIEKADTKNEDGKPIKVYALPGSFEE